jgi:hypothetical protein
MSTVAMSGNDTIIVNGRPITDLADGDCAVLSFPNEIANVKTGKNGNSIYGLNESGKQSEFVLRVIRASSDDKFLNNLLVQQQANFAGFPLMNAELVKQVGDGAGNVAGDTYICGGGIFTKQVEAKSNVEGDSAQSVSEYRMKFSNAPRAIT